MRIIEINGNDGIDLLKEEWVSLQKKCTITPFQTWEWNSVFWKHFKKGKQLHLLTVRKAASNELVGIIPLYSSLYLRTFLRRLAWVGTGHGTDYLGPIILPSHIKQVYSLFADYIANNLQKWDIADFQHLPSHFYEPMRQAFARPHSNSRYPIKNYSSVSTFICPYLPLPHTLEEFHKKLSRKFRKNLSRSWRNLNKEFKEVNLFIADSQNFKKGIKALIKLHQHRWYTRIPPGFFWHSKRRTFLYELAESFLEQGWLRLYVLEINGKIYCADCCYLYDQVMYDHFTGRSLNLNKYGIGMLLNDFIIKDAIKEGCKKYDFLQGQEHYKYRWKPLESRTSRILLRRATLDQSLIRRSVSWLIFYLKKAQGYLFNRLIT